MEKKIRNSATSFYPLFSSAFQKEDEAAAENNAKHKDFFNVALKYLNIRFPTFFDQGINVQRKDNKIIFDTLGSLDLGDGSFTFENGSFTSKSGEEQKVCSIDIEDCTTWFQNPQLTKTMFITTTNANGDNRTVKCSERIQPVTRCLQKKLPKKKQFGGFL